LPPSIGGGIGREGKLVFSKVFTRARGVAATTVVLAVVAVGALPTMLATTASASPAQGTVVITMAEPSGSFYTGFCADPGVPVLGSTNCAGGGAASISSISAPSGSVALSLPAGAYNAAVADSGLSTLSPVGHVDVLPGVSISCSFTLAAGPSCSSTPGPGPGTVVVHIDEPVGPTYAPGLCLAPGQLVLLSFNCSDGKPNHAAFLPGGSTMTLLLPEGNYTSALGSDAGGWHMGAIGTVSVVSGQTQACSFTMAAPPACTVTETFGASEVADAGDVVSTAPPGGQSALDPIGTAVITPTAGTVAIVESTNTNLSPTGYSFFGQQVTIHAPAASVAAPLSITFHLDPSIVPDGQTEQTIQVFRDGTAIAACTGAPNADPDPCVSDREISDTGEIAITVLSSHASVWNFGTSTDTAAPSITIVSPSGAPLVLQSSVQPGFSCDDGAGTGVASCVGAPLNGTLVDTTSVGTKTFTVVAKDNAGNTSQSSVDYDVVYATGDCLGAPGRAVLQPVDANGGSVFKKGSTVPVKFRVCDAVGNSIGTPGVVAGVGAPVFVSSTSTTAAVDEAAYSTTPDTAFRWDPTGRQWIFNMSTRNLTSGVKYTYRIPLNDGTAITYSFGVK
jgi:hypothetical protein